MRHEFTAKHPRGVDTYVIDGDPHGDRMLISTFRNGKDMGDDYDGASVCEADVLAELLLLAEENLRLSIDRDNWRSIAEGRK